MASCTTSTLACLNSSCSSPVSLAGFRYARYAGHSTTSDQANSTTMPPPIIEYQRSCVSRCHAGFRYARYAGHSTTGDQADSTTMPPPDHRVPAKLRIEMPCRISIRPLRGPLNHRRRGELDHRASPDHRVPAKPRIKMPCRVSIRPLRGPLNHQRPGELHHHASPDHRVAAKLRIEMRNRQSRLRVVTR